MFHIDLTEIQSYTTSQIIEGITNNDSIMTLDVIYSIIGSTSYSHEVAMEHLYIAFFLDRITKFCSIKEIVRKTDGYPKYTRYTIAIADEKDAFVANLIRYGKWFVDGALMHDVNDEFREFQAGIDNYKTNYSNPIESAYANFVTYGIYELASEADEDDDIYLEKHFFSQHPEWRYGYWKHHRKGIPSDSLYYSPYNWIIKTLDRDTIFNAIYGKAIKFEECWTRDGIAFCKFGAVETFIPNEHETLLMLSAIQNDLNFNKVRYFLSENDDILIVDNGNYSIVSFDTICAKEQRILQFYSELSQQTHYLSCLLGFDDKANVNWSKWTPELFEDLCYDIIRVKFSNKDIQLERMGSTRSRDGGRDIIIIERKPFYSNCKKYIVQCKLRTDRKSLSANRMGNVTDVVMKHKADAYIVMTNELIDSTLHDLLDGLTESKLHIDTSIRIDGKKIAHFLALHRDIRTKYITYEKNNQCQSSN